MSGPSRRPSVYESGASSLRPLAEVIVPLRTAPNEVPPVTRVRTTLVFSSRRALDDRGLLAAYSAELDPSERQSLGNLVAGRWLSIELALAHYRAIDRLGLPISEQLALGGAVATSIQNTLVATLLRMVNGLGITPWTGVAQYTRIWERLFMGGDLQVEKLSQREAVVTMYNLALFSVPYFRVAVRGLQESGLSAIYSWKKVYVSELSASETGAKYRLTWV
jgi:hypothetical protein